MKVALLGIAFAGGLLPLQPGTEATHFEFSGKAETYAVPAGVCRIQVKVTGGAGGAAHLQDNFDVATGGTTSSAPKTPGALLEGDLTVEPGQALEVVVGGNGEDVETEFVLPDGTYRKQTPDRRVRGGFNGGGDGGYPETDEVRAQNIAGTGGGGASEIRLAGSAVVIAGGGGGHGGDALDFPELPPPNQLGIGGPGGEVPEGGLHGAGFAYDGQVVLPSGGLAGSQTAGGEGGVPRQDQQEFPTMFGEAGTAGEGGHGADDQSDTSDRSGSAVSGGGGGGGLFGGGGGAATIENGGPGAGGGAGSNLVPDGFTVATDTSLTPGVTIEPVESSCSPAPTSTAPPSSSDDPAPSSQPGPALAPRFTG